MANQWNAAFRRVTDDERKTTDYGSDSIEYTLNIPSSGKMVPLEGYVHGVDGVDLHAFKYEEGKIYNANDDVPPSRMVPWAVFKVWKSYCHFRRNGPNPSELQLRSIQHLKVVVTDYSRRGPDDDYCFVLAKQIKVIEIYNHDSMKSIYNGTFEFKNLDNREIFTMVNGEIHNHIDQPAYIMYSNVTQNIMSESFYKYSKLDRRNSLPAITEYYMNGKKKFESYMEANQRHRINGPAMVEYYDDGSIQRLVYCEHGETHRIGGPAEIVFDREGNQEYIAYYEYWVHLNEDGTIYHYE